MTHLTSNEIYLVVEHMATEYIMKGRERVVISLINHSYCVGKLALYRKTHPLFCCYGRSFWMIVVRRRIFNISLRRVFTAYRSFELTFFDFDNSWKRKEWKWCGFMIWKPWQFFSFLTVFTLKESQFWTFLSGKNSSWGNIVKILYFSLTLLINHFLLFRTAMKWKSI